MAGCHRPLQETSGRWVLRPLPIILIPKPRPVFGLLPSAGLRLPGPPAVREVSEALAPPFSLGLSSWVRPAGPTNRHGHTRLATRPPLWSRCHL